MPFNGSGSFSILNFFIPNTTILSSAVNANFSDIATGLSDCLTRDNQAGMTAVFRAVSGTSSAPGITFNSDTTSGLYLPSTGILGLVAEGLGLKLNAQIFQAQSATVQAGGSGYAVGDTITETGGTSVSPVVATVATLSGTAVATVTITVPGLYTAKPTNPVAQGSTSGSGTGATLNITWNDPTSSAYRMGITNISDTSAMPYFGFSSFVDGLKGKANGLDFMTGVGAANIIAASGISPAPKSSFSNLTVKVLTNTTVGIAADAVVCWNGTSSYQLATSVSATCNLGTTGANALDTGTIATNSWYFMFVIMKPDGTKAVLASLSATAPTMPTGYTFFGRVGAVQTINASATLYGTWQIGKRAQYFVGLAQTTIAPVIESGTVGGYSTTSPGPLSLPTVVGNGFFVPSTASTIIVNANNSWKNNTLAAVIVAPVAQWGGTNNGPLGSNGMSWPIYLNAATNSCMQATLLLQATTIAWASSATGGAVSCFGWEDNL